MSIKWRKHEYLLANLVAGLGILLVLIQLLNLKTTLADQRDWKNDERVIFGIRFLLASEICNILMLYGAHRWVNAAVIAFRKRSRWYLAFPWLILQVLVVSYCLGPVVNWMSYYVISGSGGQAFPMFIGYHPQPLFNLFGGWSIVLFLVSLYTLYALVREFCMVRISRNPYSILVANRLTSLAVAYFGIAFVFVFMRAGDSKGFAYYLSMVPAAGILLFVNLYYVFPKYEGRRRLGFRFALDLLIVVLATSVSFMWILSRADGDGWPILFWVQLLMVTPISWLVYRTQKDEILAFRGVREALAKSNADLASLRAQINPHFLFNSLNALYAAALREEAPNTASGIQQLGDMMRFMLHDNQQDRIAMGREVEYLNDYLALQQLRMGASSGVRINSQITVADEGLPIAPMLFIPFVENAFKHGISLEAPSWVSVVMEGASDGIRFEVRNSLHAGLVSDPIVSGTGLRNVQERLDLIYPRAHELHFGPRDGEYVVSLSIKIRK